MRKILKVISLTLTATITSALIGQAGYDMKVLASSAPRTQVALKKDSLDLSNPIFITDKSDTLLQQQQNDVTTLVDAIINELESDSYFENMNYSKEIVSNSEKRGKAGLTAKAAAKILKAGLKKLGKKGYERLAKKSGLQLVKLNWKVINKIANRLGGFDDKVDNALKKLLKQEGFSNYWAGTLSKVISFVFF